MEMLQELIRRPSLFRMMHQQRHLLLKILYLQKKCQMKNRILKCKDYWHVNSKAVIIIQTTTSQFDGNAVGIDKETELVQDDAPVETFVAENMGTYRRNVR